MDRAVASTTTQHESYAAVGTVELVADGDVVASGVTGGAELRSSNGDVAYLMR